MFGVGIQEVTPQTLEEWDALRDAIAVGIGGAGPDRWPAIVFTADPERAV